MTLTNRLCLLEKTKLVKHTIYNTRPIRMSYELTEFGNGVGDLIIPLIYYIKLPKLMDINKEKSRFNL